MTVKFLLSGLFVVFFLSGAAYIFNRAEAEKTSRYFARALAPLSTREEVAHKGKTYEVRGGEVLRLPERERIEGTEALAPLALAYAKTLARRSPLMAMAGNDPAELKTLTERLEVLQNQIADLQKKQDGAKLIRRALYPLSFLRAMAETEEKRQIFLQEATMQTLQAYLNAREASIASYRKDLASYASAFAAAVPNSSARFSLGTALVSSDDMRNAIERLKRAIDPVAQKNRDERLCLRGVTRVCDPLDLEALPAKRFSADPLPPDMPAKIREFSKVLPIVTRGESYPTASTSKVMLSESRCAPESDIPAVYDVQSATSTTDGSYFRKIRFIGDLRYIRSDSLPNVAFYRYFAERGVLYIPANHLLHYVCPEFFDEISRVRAVEEVRAYAERNELSGLAGGTPIAEVEKSLIQGVSPLRVAQEYVSRNYLAAALSLLRAEALNERSSNDLLELLLSVRNGTVGWSDALQIVLETDTANVLLYKQGVPVDLEAAYVFFFRTPALFFFMAGNPSVSAGVRIEGAPISALQRDPYLYYSEISSSEAITKKVAEDTTFYRILHRKPLLEWRR
jgi:hypothetical protein